MNKPPLLSAAAASALILAWMVAQAGEFAPLQVEHRDDGTVGLQLEAAPGSTQRIEFSSDLESWQPLMAIEMPASGSFTGEDATSSLSARRYYRAVPISGDSLTGDYLNTSAGDVLIHPVDHASFVMQWDGKMIYNDPVGGSAAFDGIPPADLVLVGHRHGDHFNSGAIAAVSAASSQIIAPQDVFDLLPAVLKSRTTVLSNGATTEVMGLMVEAVPAYNDNHPQGRDNGYIVTIGGQRIYMSGDTGDIAEMRALEDIDLAFVAMNVPWTMSVDQAASAVLDFKPAILYPYHFRNQGGSFADFDRLKSLIGDEETIELRLRDWY
ncbi:MAG: MBL fold metallo-hydrolase [Verrucomicrobiales bacterium]